MLFNKICTSKEFNLENEDFSKTATISFGASFSASYAYLDESRTFSQNC